MTFTSPIVLEAGKSKSMVSESIKDLNASSYHGKRHMLSDYPSPLFFRYKTTIVITWFLPVTSSNPNYLAKILSLNILIIIIYGTWSEVV